VVDFINEVEEELRKDEYNVLLRRYGPYLLGLVIAIVMATGFIEWRKVVTDKDARATSAAFVEANNLAQAGDLEKASRQFLAIAEKAPEGYAGLSLLRSAGLEQERGNVLKAVSLYDRAADVFTTSRHQQLAQIKAAYILANEGRFDDVSSRVEALAQNDEPYEFLARELRGFAAMKSGDVAIARQEFSYLATIPGVPEPIQQRAEQSLSLMQVDARNAALRETVVLDDSMVNDKKTMPEESAASVTSLESADKGSENE